MVSLAHALRSFHSGALSRDALFAEIDRILEGGRASRNWLLETLDRENTQVPLPPDVHNAVRARIERAENRGHDAHNTSSQDTAGEFVDPDESFTRLATNLPFEGPTATEIADGLRPLARSKDRHAALLSPGDDLVKGTGDVLNGRFILEERIGAGGMSSVYKALDRRRLEANDRNPYVAVKVLNVEFRARPDSLIALQREAKKSQSLAHPNIVRVYDFDRDGTTVYMTMEYLAGEPLAKRLRAPNFTGMDPTDAMRILEAMANALAFAHDNCIVHADFKPGNVILTTSGQVKVIDCGIARAFQRPDATDQEMTRFDPGSLGALTPTYASPEMLEHQEPDPRDDIYALACITYEMLTGRHPFGRMMATEARDGGLVLERRPKLSRRQYRALKSALAFDRQKRTPTVRQFLSDIRPEPRLSGSFALYKVGRVAAALVVAGAGAYYLTGVMHQTDAPSSVGAGSAAPMIGSQIKSVELAGLEQPEEPPATKPPAAAAAKTKPAAAAVAASTPAAGETLAAVTKPPPVPDVASVRSLLQGIPCSAIDVSVSNGAVALRGFLSDGYGAKRLEQNLKALRGVKSVVTDLVGVSADKCPIIDLYAPYWIKNRGLERSASIKIRSRDAAIFEGEPLVVDISTPAYESYVNVDYYALDGTVVHMVPNPHLRNNQAPANYRATLGDLGEWKASAPFGSEMVVLLITPRPLFDVQRGEYENERDYLAALDQRLERIAKESGKQQVAADFVMIDTKPKPATERRRN
ncbi:MAG: protein kinase [Thiohalobacteraceae bacterium]